MFNIKLTFLTINHDKIKKKVVDDMRKSEYDKLKKESYLKKSKSNQSLFEDPHLVLNILYKNYQNSKKINK